jgi:hypothetical protein
MKLKIALLIAAVLSGYQVGADPSLDPTEVLTQHLLDRIQDLSLKIVATQKRCIEEDDARPRDNIAGRREVDQLVAVELNKKKAHDFSQDMRGNFDQTMQNLNDGDAFIALHNRRHPESPWVGGNYETLDRLLREPRKSQP